MHAAIATDAASSCPRTRRQTGTAGEQPTDTLDVHADKQTVSGPENARVTVFEGNVDIRIGIYRLQADKVTDIQAKNRVVAEGKNPIAYTAETCMSGPVVTVRADAPLEEVVSTMEKHQIRRVPVVDERDSCVGIISQADISWSGGPREVAELVREVSRDTGRESR